MRGQPQRRQGSACAIQSLHSIWAIVLGRPSAVNGSFDERRVSVAADPRIDARGIVDDGGTDIALPYGAARHFEHPLERHSGARHDLIRKLDPRLEVAQRDVELL